MYTRVLKFADALLEYFSRDADLFERVLRLRHEIRKRAYRSADTDGTARGILNEFSAHAMPDVVDAVVSVVTEERMEKWVNFIEDQKSPAYTEPSSSRSSSYSSSSNMSSSTPSSSSSSSSSSNATYSDSSKSN